MDSAGNNSFGARGPKLESREQRRHGTGKSRRSAAVRAARQARASVGRRTAAPSSRRSATAQGWRQSDVGRGLSRYSAHCGGANARPAPWATRPLPVKERCEPACRAAEEARPGCTADLPYLRTCPGVSRPTGSPTAEAVALGSTLSLPLAHRGTAAVDCHIGPQVVSPTMARDTCSRCRSGDITECSGAAERRYSVLPSATAPPW